MKFLSSRKAIVENNSCLIEFKKQLFIKTKKKNALNVAGVGVFVIELKIGKKENGKMYYKKETVSDELFRNIYSVLCCSYYTLGLFQMKSLYLLLSLVFISQFRIDTRKF